MKPLPGCYLTSGSSSIGLRARFDRFSFAHTPSSPYGIGLELHPRRLKLFHKLLSCRYSLRIISDHEVTHTGVEDTGLGNGTAIGWDPYWKGSGGFLSASSVENYGKQAFGQSLHITCLDGASLAFQFYGKIHVSSRSAEAV